MKFNRHFLFFLFCSLFLFSTNSLISQSIKRIGNGKSIRLDSTVFLQINPNDPLKTSGWSVANKYDSLGRLSENTRYNLNRRSNGWIFESMRKYAYKDTLLAMREGYKWDNENQIWIGTFKSQIEYYDNTDLIKLQIQNYDWDVDKNKWKYDETTRKIKNTYNDSGKLESSIVLTYDAETNTFKEKEEYIEFFENDRLIKCRYAKEPESDEWIQTRRTEKDFDESGNLIREANYVYESSLTKIVKVFEIVNEYDSNGNQVKSNNYIWKYWKNGLSGTMAEYIFEEERQELAGKYTFDTISKKWNRVDGYKQEKFVNTEGDSVRTIQYRWDKKNMKWYKSHQMDAYYINDTLIQNDFTSSYSPNSIQIFRSERFNEYDSIGNLIYRKTIEFSFVPESKGDENSLTIDSSESNSTKNGRKVELFNEDGKNTKIIISIWDNNKNSWIYESKKELLSKNENSFNKEFVWDKYSNNWKPTLLVKQVSHTEDSMRIVYNRKYLYNDSISKMELRSQSKYVYHQNTEVIINQRYNPLEHAIVNTSKSVHTNSKNGDYKKSESYQWDGNKQKWMLKNSFEESKTITNTDTIKHKIEIEYDEDGNIFSGSKNEVHFDKYGNEKLNLNKTFYSDSNEWYTIMRSEKFYSIIEQ